MEKLTEFVTRPDPATKQGSMGSGFENREAAAKPAGGAAKPAAAKPPPSNFNVVVTGATNNNYWMIGGMQVGRSIQIDPWR